MSLSSYCSYGMSSSLTKASSRFGNELKEKACGWGKISVVEAQRSQTYTIEIKGGTPMVEINIKQQDVHTRRTGWKGVVKTFSRRINSQLKVSVRPL